MVEQTLAIQDSVDSHKEMRKAFSFWNVYREEAFNERHRPSPEMKTDWFSKPIEVPYSAVLGAIMALTQYTWRSWETHLRSNEAHFEGFIPHPVRFDSSYKFNEEKRAFYELSPVLIGNPDYNGKYVAIVNGKIQDRDEEQEKLVKRMYTKFGNVPMYVGKISPRKRVLEISSPERP